VFSVRCGVGAEGMAEGVFGVLFAGEAGWGGTIPWGPGAGFGSGATGAALSIHGAVGARNMIVAPGHGG